MTEKTNTTRIVQVSFNRQNGMRLERYAYMTDIADIDVGDVVVVDSPNSGLTLVTVETLEETPESVSKATKWIVDRVNVKAYHARLERDKQRGLILAKLKKEQARVLEANQFAELAKLSPEAAALVEQLKGLDA